MYTYEKECRLLIHIKPSPTKLFQLKGNVISRGVPLEALIIRLEGLIVPQPPIV